MSKKDGWIAVNNKQKDKEKKKLKEKKLAQQKEEFQNEKTKHEQKYKQQQQSLADRAKAVEAAKPKKANRFKPEPIDITSDSIFTPLEEMMMMKERKKELKRLQLLQEQQAAEAGEQVQVPQKKAKKKKPKKASAKAAALAIDANELQAHLQTILERFHGSDDVQLKALAERMESYFLNIASDNQKAKQKSFERKLEIPLDYLEDDVENVLIEWLSRYNQQALANFLVWCLVTLVSFTKGDKPEKQATGVGLKLLLQLLAKGSPSVVVAAVPQLKQNFLEGKALDNVSAGLLFWTAGQTLSSPAHALNLWCELLYPILRVPKIDQAVSNDIATFIETLLSQENDLAGKKKVSLSPTTLQDIFLLKPAVHASVQQRIENLHESILDAVLVGSGNFGNTLGLLSLDLEEEQQEQVLGYLVDTLTQDDATYGVWSKVYNSKITPTTLLLNHILANWSNLKNKVSHPELYELLQAFVKHNTKVQGKGKMEEAQACTDVSQQLIEKVKPASLGSKIMKALGGVVLVVGVGSAVLYTQCCTLIDPKICATYLSLHCKGI